MFVIDNYFTDTTDGKSPCMKLNIFSFIGFFPMENPQDKNMLYGCKQTP